MQPERKCSLDKAFGGHGGRGADSDNLPIGTNPNNLNFYRRSPSSNRDVISELGQGQSVARRRGHEGRGACLSRISEQLYAGHTRMQTPYTAQVSNVGTEQTAPSSTVDQRLIRGFCPIKKILSSQ